MTPTARGNLGNGRRRDRVAESLGGQPREDLGPATEKLALAGEADRADDQADRTAGGIEVGTVDLNLDEVALPGRVLQSAGITPEHLAGQQRLAVGEVEVQHPVGPRLDLLNLALQHRGPDLSQRATQPRGVLGYGQDIGLHAVVEQGQRTVGRRADGPDSPI